MQLAVIWTVKGKLFILTGCCMDYYEAILSAVLYIDCWMCWAVLVVAVILTVTEKICI